MKIDVNNIEATLANLATKGSGEARPKLVEGQYECKIEEIEFSRGFKDNTKYRLKVKWSVIADLNGDTTYTGALRNQYISVAGVDDTDKILTIVSPIVKVAMNAGIIWEKINDDVDTADELLANVASLINKRLSKGEVVKTKLSFKKNPKEENGFYINYIW